MSLIAFAMHVRNMPSICDSITIEMNDQIERYFGKRQTADTTSGNGSVSSNNSLQIICKHVFMQPIVAHTYTCTNVVALST